MRKREDKNLDIQIKTQRLIICPLEMKFLDSTYAYSSDLENTKYMLFLPVDSRKEAVEFLRSSEEEWQKENPLFFEFAMLKDGIHIGGCSLYLCDDRDTGELGWIVDKKYWRCGYASEAARYGAVWCRAAWSYTFYCPLRQRKYRLIPSYGKAWNETYRLQRRQKKQVIG